MTGQQRTVRVFISSTFRDMQQERDHLMRVVFPELEQRCAHRGLSLLPVDLRWGVTREEAENSEAFHICLREVEACRPFFLCLLGERYGWTPLPPRVDAQLVTRLAEGQALLLAQAYYENEYFGELRLRTERQREATWGHSREYNERRLLQALEELEVPGAGESITAKEVRCGVLNAPEEWVRGLFYFRARALTEKLAGQCREDFFENTDAGREKLASLKTEIQRAGMSPEEYEDIEGLGERTLEQLWERIVQQFPQTRPAAADSLAEEREAHWLFVHRLTRLFCGRRKTLAELDSLIADKPGYIAVTGLSGCGKTALLANWLYGQKGYVSQHPDTFVLSHFIGASGRSANLREMLSRLTSELASTLDTSETLPTGLDDLRVAFPRILAAAGRCQPVLIIIDALDQLEAADNARALDWLPEALPDGITVLASSLSDEDCDTWVPLHARARDRVLPVSLLASPEAREMIIAYLDQYRHRLDPEQLAVIAAKDEARSPLYLRVALNELLKFGDYERLTEHLRQVPGTVPAMYEFMLKHLEREHGRRFVAKVMSFLACGRYGMAEHELLALAAQAAVEGGEGKAVAPLKWARLHRILAPHLLERNDVITFYHRQLREAVERRYLRETASRTHADIARYYEGRPLSDKRKLEEQPWQQTRGELWGRLATSLTDYDFIKAKCEAGMAQDLVSDYQDADLYLPSAGFAEHTQTCLAEWSAFIVGSAHKLQHGAEPFAQVAFNHADDGYVATDAQRHLQALQEPWLRLLNRPRRSRGPACVRTIENVHAHIVAFTPKGELAVVASGGKLGLWDLTSGLCMRAVDSQFYRVRVVVLAPDETRVISLGEMKSGASEIILWDLRRCVRLGSLEGHDGRLTCLAASADGSRAVAACAEGTAWVWDVATKERIASFTQEGGIGALYMTQHGSGMIAHAVFDTPENELAKMDQNGRFRIACRSSDGTRAELVVWQVDPHASEARQVQILTGHESVVKAVVLSADGRHAYSMSGPMFCSPLGSHGVEVRRWDISSGACLWTAVVESASARVLGVTRDENHLLLAEGQQVSDAGVIQVWDMATGECVERLAEHPCPITALAVLLDGRHVATTDAEGRLNLWDLKSPTRCMPAETHHREVSAVAATPDGRHAVTGSHDMTLRMWDLTTGACKRTLEGHRARISALAVTPNGNELLSGSGIDFELAEVNVWSLPYGRYVEALDMGDRREPIIALAVTRDGCYIVSASTEFGGPGEIRVWDSQGFLHSMQGHNGTLLAMALHPVLPRAYTVGLDYVVRVWDLMTGQPLLPLGEVSQEVTCLHITPNGQRLVLGGFAGDVEIWDLDGRCRLYRLHGHRGNIRGMAITPDGRTVIAAHDGLGLETWDIESGECVRTLAGHQGVVSGALVAHDNRRAFSYGSDQTVRMWDLRSGIQTGCFQTQGLPQSGIVSSLPTRVVIGDTMGNVYILYPQDTPLSEDGKIEVDVGNYSQAKIDGS